MRSIVAVHGINGHRIKTWTCPDDGTMWLRDMLPEKIPKARIMSFGYGSHASSVISAQSIKETANELLKALQDKRGNDVSPLNPDNVS